MERQYSKTTSSFNTNIQVYYRNNKIIVTNDKIVKISNVKNIKK